MACTSQPNPFMPQESPPSLFSPVSDTSPGQDDRIRLLAEAQAIAHVGGWEWDMVEDRVIWSDELYRIHGLEPGAPIDFGTYLGLVHPDDRERVRQTVGDGAETGRPFEFDHRIVRPDGEIRWVHGRGRTVRWKDGEPSRMAGTGQDITELQRARNEAQRAVREEAGREAAEEAARRMAFLARASAELASSLDYEETLRTVVRLAVPEMADWSSVHLVLDDGSIHRLAVEHPDPDRVELVRELDRRHPLDPDAGHGVARVIRTGESEMISDVPDELLIEIARDERHLEILRGLDLTSFLSAPLTARGKVLGAVTLVFAESKRRYDDEDRLLVEDLARRAATAIDNARLLEELAARNQELREAVDAKSSFVATMSHELRTPLNAIMGYTQLLEQGIPVPLPEPAEAQVKRIHSAGTHLLQLIDEILAFSRVEAGREAVVRKRFDPRELLDETRAIMERLCEEKGLEFHIVAKELPDRISTDPGKVRQILVNLLGNAVKFTEQGSVSLIVRGGDDRTVFQVRDTGPGIPAEELEHLFEPFWQSDRAVSRTLGGTGLGLTISNRYARILGGDLAVESTVGEGSTFTLSLPVEPEGDDPGG